MSVGSAIYQKQGRLKITLDTGQDLNGMHRTQILYKTPSGKEVTLEAAVVDDTKLTATISPLEDEVGMFTFHSAVTVSSGELPVLGKAVAILVQKKWSAPIIYR